MEGPVDLVSCRTLRHRDSSGVQSSLCCEKEALKRKETFTVVCGCYGYGLCEVHVHTSLVSMPSLVCVHRDSWRCSFNYLIISSCKKLLISDGVRGHLGVASGHLPCSELVHAVLTS